MPIMFTEWPAGIILSMGSANESRRYIVTSSLIGWAHTQNDPWAKQRSSVCASLTMVWTIAALNAQITTENRSCYDANFVFTSSTRDFRYDNPQWHQWQQRWHQHNSRLRKGADKEFIWNIIFVFVFLISLWNQLLKNGGVIYLKIVMVIKCYIFHAAFAIALVFLCQLPIYFFIDVIAWTEQEKF